MREPAGWSPETADLFSATLHSAGGRQFLLVERLPITAPESGGWDWVVWTSECNPRSISGRAGTAVQAMKAAELAAILLKGGKLSLPGFEPRGLQLAPFCPM